MALPIVGEETLVFKLIGGCACNGCKDEDKVLKPLKRIQGVGLMEFREGKLTIQGSNVDPNMVIAKLKKEYKTFELVTKDNPSPHEIVEQQIRVNRREVSNEASSVVIYEEPAHNQVFDSPGLSTTPPLHFRPNQDHVHEFELQNYDKRFTCDGCKEDGFKKGYRCKHHCNYELHEDCKHPKPTVSHELFEGSDFEFCNQKPTCDTTDRTKSCEACGKGIHGFSYHCKAKGLYLHPMCVKFQGKLCIEGETFTLKKEGNFKCFWCNVTKKTKSGWSYVSKSTKCQLHVNCVAEIVHEAWKEQDIGGGKDEYAMEGRRKLDLVKKNEKSKWSKVDKLVKMIRFLARTIFGILLGDPTVIVASMLMEMF